MPVQYRAHIGIIIYSSLLLHAIQKLLKKPQLIGPPEKGQLNTMHNLIKDKFEVERQANVR